MRIQSILRRLYQKLRSPYPIKKKKVKGDEKELKMYALWDAKTGRVPYKLIETCPHCKQPYR